MRARHRTPHGIGRSRQRHGYRNRGRAFGSSINRTVPRSRAAPPPAPPGARRSGGSTRGPGGSRPVPHRKRFRSVLIISPDLSFRHDRTDDGTASGRQECENPGSEKRGNSLASVSYQGRGVPMGTVHKGPCNATQRRPRRSIPTRHSTVLVIRFHVTAVAFGLRCTRELCVLRSCEDPRPGSARAQSRSRRRRTSES